MQHRVVVIGAGIMGARICKHILRSGHPVALIDPSKEALENAEKTIGNPREALTTHTKIDALPDLWRAAMMVIEVVPEVLSLKHQVIADSEAFFDDSTLIASNTSGLPTAELTKNMRCPERFVITHFFNPADLIPAVELVPGPKTSEAVVAKTAAFLQSTGKKVARLRADVPGFIANRLQHALMRECFHLMATGVADAEAIDLVTRYALGVRLAMIGPLLQRDLNGLDTHLNIARYLYADLDARDTPPETLARMVAAGDIGRKSGQGFYTWDAEQQTKMEQIERLLPELIALAAQVDANEGELRCQNG